MPGSIIVISSLAGLRGGEGAGQNISYTVAKHAQVGVVCAAARALAPRGIRVNASIQVRSTTRSSTKSRTASARSAASMSRRR
ncbi:MULTISPECIES: SDR family oxidoreductase [unclassified Mesorhizobium]|uniref:SDR family oxidoreductase n=1 Tax=unclassified Mesorhizobium TaxID=325217 RepID=UPI0003CF7BFF|nr:hypothetical protein X759_11910 [Mesorhizobium sp. LSHC420B00]